MAESKTGCSKLGSMLVSTLFCLYLRINIGKTSQKVTKDKDTKLVGAGRRAREHFMKKLKENILNDAKKGGGDTINSSNETNQRYQHCHHNIN